MSVQELIREELKATNYNVSKVARTLGLDYKQLRDDNAVVYAPLVRPKGPIPGDIRTLGKVGMQQYVIAVKVQGEAWPITFHNALQDARSKYDAGTHEMCQEKRKDGYIVQYLVPRKTPVTRKRPFFEITWGRN